MTSQLQSQTYLEDPTVPLRPAPGVSSPRCGLAQVMLPADLPVDSLTACKSSAIQVRRSHHTAATPEEACSSWLLGEMSDGQDTGTDGCSGRDGGFLSTSCPPAMQQWMAGKGAEGAQRSTSHIHVPSCGSGAHLTRGGTFASIYS